MDTNRYKIVKHGRKVVETSNPLMLIKCPECDAEYDHYSTDSDISVRYFNNPMFYKDKNGTKMVYFYKKCICKKCDCVFNYKISTDVEDYHMKFIDFLLILWCMIAFHMVFSVLYYYCCEKSWLNTFTISMGASELLLFLGTIVFSKLKRKHEIKYGVDSEFMDAVAYTDLSKFE